MLSGPRTEIQSPLGKVSVCSPTQLMWHAGLGLMPWEMLCQCYGASPKLAVVQTQQGLHFTGEHNQSHIPSVYSSWLPPWASMHSACGELHSTGRIYAFCLPCWALLGRFFPFCASLPPVVNRDELCSCGLLGLEEWSLSSPLGLCFIPLSPSPNTKVILGWLLLVYEQPPVLAAVP